ncbi:MAG: glycosyltransferase [Pseudomonadota bacterium]
MAVVVCARWFDAFPTSYVHVLKNAVAASLERQHRFICLTDNPDALGPDIETAALPDMNIPLAQKRHGCWPKVAMFKPGLLPPEEPTLFLDLDIMVRQDLEAFFAQIEADRTAFNALREWNPALWEFLPASVRPDRGVQSSIVGFYPAEQAYIFETFMADQKTHFKTYPNDQRFLTGVSQRLNYWPIDWTVSFKRHCLRYYPLNKVFPKIHEPDNAKIVVFHGKPRPIDVVHEGNDRWGTSRKFGHGPVDWVRNYWIKNDPSWASKTDGIGSQQALRSDLSG